MTSKDSTKRTRQKRNCRSSTIDGAISTEAIRQIDLRSALEFYGLQFNNRGAALCPFHAEKTASFLVKGKFWHCFGCGETGDLIAFVRKSFDMSYKDALEAIARDFKIIVKPRISDQERLDRKKLERYNNKRRFEELLTRLDEATYDYWLAYDTSEFIANHTGGKNPGNDMYVAAQFMLLKAKFALEQAEYDCAQYLREHPDATPMPPSSNHTTNVKLPPAPLRRVTSK